jgi:hypothetical protein
MIGFLVLLFPVLLMLFMLAMERLEQPLTRVNTEQDVEEFLDRATPAELSTFVREGTESGLRRFGLRVNRLRRPGWRTRAK